MYPSQATHAPKLLPSNPHTLLSLVLFCLLCLLSLFKFFLVLCKSFRKLHVLRKQGMHTHICPNADSIHARASANSMPYASKECTHTYAQAQTAYVQEPPQSPCPTQARNAHTHMPKRWQHMCERAVHCMRWAADLQPLWWREPQGGFWPKLVPLPQLMSSLTITYQRREPLHCQHSYSASQSISYETHTSELPRSGMRAGYNLGPFVGALVAC